MLAPWVEGWDEVTTYWSTIYQPSPTKHPLAPTYFVDQATMDNPFNYKIPQHGFLPPNNGGPGPALTRPSPTTSSPHSATHPSPLIASFARGFNGNQAEFDKMMSSMGNFQKMSGIEGMQFNGMNGGRRDDGRGFDAFGSGIDYAAHGQSGRNAHAGPSNGGQERQMSNPPNQGNSNTAGATAKRGSKACVACEWIPVSKGGTDDRSKRKESM